MLEDFRLKVFLTVERCRSFTAAAHELHITQPAVSQNIAELEKTLGAPLFERNRHEISLTDKGRLFKDYAAEILHWYQLASEALSADSASPARLTLELEEGRTAEVWSSGGDIHISMK